VTAFVGALLLAAVCWVLRVLLVAAVPAERLPGRVREALADLAPAVLASLVSVDLVGAARGTHPLGAVVMLAGMALVALLVRRTGSLALAVGAGAVAALILDLVLG
jgi:branched-subunit amino acid transport protein